MLISNFSLAKIKDGLLSIPINLLFFRSGRTKLIAVEKHCVYLKPTFIFNSPLLVLTYKSSNSGVLTVIKNFVLVARNSIAKVPLLHLKKTEANQGYRVRERKKYYFNGLGYKVFVIRDQLFIWVGYTHYTLITIPRSIRVIAKKKRFYVLGFNRGITKQFFSKLRSIKKIDVYKGKGLLEAKTYKNFIRMKSGKKKQY